MLARKIRAVALGRNTTAQRIVVNGGTYHICRRSSNRKIKFLPAARKTPRRQANRFEVVN